MEEPELCARCRGTLCDESGYCGHCHWEVEIEIDAGLQELGRYLERWAGFSDWLEENGVAA